MLLPQGRQFEMPDEPRGPSEGARVAIVGGGPAGLIAAEMLSAAGCRVVVYERMPTFGRKLLMAGRGGLNLTHSEPLERFRTRYGEAGERIAPYLDAFPQRRWSPGPRGSGSRPSSAPAAGSSRRR